MSTEEREERREFAMDEIYEALRKQGGKFAFQNLNECPSVKTESDDDTIRVLELYIDEDGDIMFHYDNFTEEVYDTGIILDVTDEGVIEIAKALRLATKKDYTLVLDGLREEILEALWCEIEEHKDDERCYCPPRFSEVSIKESAVCDIDINGYTYDVDFVRISLWNEKLRAEVMLNGQWYGVEYIEDLAKILQAVRKTLSK